MAEKDLHPLAQRVPKCKKTGNFIEDSDNNTKRRAFQQIIHECMNDDTHIMALQGFLVERLSSRMKHEFCDESGQFEKLTTLKAIPQSWKATWLTQHSDLSMADIGRMKSAEPDIVDLLMVLGAQVRLMQTLPQELCIKAVANRMFKLRHFEVGSPLQKFKERGMVLPTGEVDWKQAGRYTLTFREGRLHSILHIASAGVVELPAGIVVSPEYGLYQNWSDREAYLELAPMPKIIIHTLFPKGVGPHALPDLSSGKPSLLVEKAKACLRGWEEDMARAAAGAKDGDTHELNQVDKEMRKAVTKRARDAAVVAAAAKKQKRKVIVT